MKKIFLFLACTSFFSLHAICSDSVFTYILVPQQAKLKAGNSITFQLLKYDSARSRYNINTDDPILVNKWLINGSIGVQSSETPFGRLEGLPNSTAIKYYAPKEKPKDNIIRVSCEYNEDGKKNILFAYIEIEEFTNGFCIDPMNVAVNGSGMKNAQCFTIETLDFKATRESGTLDKVSQYKNLTPQQKLQIEQLKAQQKMANVAADNQKWMKNMSTGNAVFNVTCNTLIISVSNTDMNDQRAISVIVPARKPGTYYTAYDNCMITLAGGKPVCGMAVSGQGYISQYCKKNENGECEPVVIPAVIYIESYGKEGELVTGYFSGRIGKLICEDIPQIHAAYGYFSVVRQPDVKVECGKNK